jgi:hypothetical protein
LRMKRVTYPVNSTTLNTTTLYPKNWLNGYSANRAKYWCHERCFVAQGKILRFGERFANLKYSRIKIRATFSVCLFRRPYVLRRRYAATRLLGSRVRILLRAWMFVSYVSCAFCR